MQSLGRVAVLAFLILATLALGHPARAQSISTPPDFRVAFLGDSGVNANAQAVLQRIEDEGADMAIHLGDMGYGNESAAQANAWNTQLTNVLGPAFPYFWAVGNHDVAAWSTYQQLLEDRIALIPGASCTDDPGLTSACTYQGLFFVLSGIGSLPTAQDYGPHITYLANALSQDNSVWRICAWHKNQQAMQVGGKPDEVGWQAYEACREGRAIIATGHEHSYSRTKTLSNTQTQTVDPSHTDGSSLRVSPGSTFVFVSGLGGNSIRDQQRCLPTTPPYGCNGEWASIVTSNQGANHGVLFIDFHVDGNPNKASGYFKEIDGDVRDTFTVITEVPVGGTTVIPDVGLAADDSVWPGVLVIAGLVVVVGFAMYLIYRRQRAAAS